MKKYLALFAILYGCVAVAAEQPEHILVEFWQDADSARYAITWTAGAQGVRQRATAYYEVELVSASVVLAADTTTLLTDTLAVSYPPLDSTISLLARVRAIDTDGDASTWAESSTFVLESRKISPSPPGNVVADTIPTVIALFLRPAIVNTIEDGGVVQFCSFYLLSNGQTGHVTNNNGIARCDELYSRWLTERSA